MPKREVPSNANADAEADDVGAGEPMTAAELWSVPSWAQLEPPRPVLETFPFTIDREFVRALPARRKPYLALESLDHVVSSGAPGGVIEDLLQPTAVFDGEGEQRVQADMPLRHRLVVDPSSADEGDPASSVESARPMIRFAEEDDRAPLIGEHRPDMGDAPVADLPVVQAEASHVRYASALDVAVQRPTSLRVLPTPSPVEWTSLLEGVDQRAPLVLPQSEGPTATVGMAEQKPGGNESTPQAAAPDSSPEEVGKIAAGLSDLPDGPVAEDDAAAHEPMTVPMETGPAFEDATPATTESAPSVPLSPTAGRGPAQSGPRTLPLASPDTTSNGPDADGSARSATRRGLGSPLPGLPHSAIPFTGDGGVPTSDHGLPLPLADVRPELAQGTPSERQTRPTATVPALPLRNRDLVVPQLPDLEDLSPPATDVPVVLPVPAWTDLATPSPSLEPVRRPVGAGDSVRHEVEDHLNVDLSGVRVDRSPTATDEAHDLDALAFTDNRGVHLPPSAGPETSAPTRALLAHEFTHAAQRRRLGNRMPEENSPAGRRLEAEAEAVERAIAISPTKPQRDALALPGPGVRTPGSPAATSSSGGSPMAAVTRAALMSMGRGSTGSPDRPGVLMGIAPWEETTPAARIGGPGEASPHASAMVQTAEGADGVRAPAAAQLNSMLVTESAGASLLAPPVPMPVFSAVLENRAPTRPAESAVVLGQPLVGFDPGVALGTPTATPDLATAPSARLYGAATWTPETATVPPAPTGGSPSLQAASGAGPGFGDVAQRKRKSSKRSKRSKSSETSTDRPERMDDAEVDILVDQILPVIRYRLRSELRRERDNSGSLTGLF